MASKWHVGSLLRSHPASNTLVDCRRDFLSRKLSREGPSWGSMKKELELFAFSCDKYVSGLWTHKELFEGQGQVMFRVERCGLGSTFQWNWLICLEVF